MDFEYSDTCQQLITQVERFMDDQVYPNEALVGEQIRESGDPHCEPPILKELRAKAKGLGLWNLFLPDKEHGAGLSNLEYAPLCEIMGRSAMGSRVFNCNAPDTGNMEILAEFGSPEQKERWLTPLLEGEIRSCFSMTEPEVSGADPTGLQTQAVLDGDEYVINGHKWFTSGAYGAAFAIVMAVTDRDAPPHARQSQIIVPIDTPGFNLLRPVSVMGHSGGGGHCEIRYEDCRVPVSNRLGPEHSGFMIAQARLGPGRIHHCMRCIGMAERAFEIMCRHATTRVAFGGPLAEKQFVQEWVATSRMEIDQARLLTEKAAWKMDVYGKKDARQEISMIKVVVPNMMMNVLDRVIQCLGSLGVSDDTPVAAAWRNGRSMRIADGPDEVHKMVIARRELRRFA
ncbi:MAG: acyl-CoA dehydrogenase family protein [Deltaproteobacteria bacterium]|nr:acyl-CoA dehydrogenase family protein [Deltaproteobacteria bacterium]